MWMKLSFKHAWPQYIGMVYRPPDGDPDIALNDLNDQLVIVHNMGNGGQMFIGDINIDWNRKRDSKTKKNLQTFTRTMDSQIP